MPSLKRTKVRPSFDALSDGEAHYVQTNFVEYAGEVVVNGQAVAWSRIEEVEVVRAARASGLAGLVVRHLIHGNVRYHVGIYFGGSEAVLPNVTLDVAKYVVESIAFYAPSPVKYRSAEDLGVVIVDDD